MFVLGLRVVFMVRDSFVVVLKAITSVSCWVGPGVGGLALRQVALTCDNRRVYKSGKERMS